MSLAFFAKGFGNLGLVRTQRHLAEAESSGYCRRRILTCACNMAASLRRWSSARDFCQYSVVRLCHFIRWFDGTYWSHFIFVYRRPAGSHHADIIRSPIVHIANSSPAVPGLHHRNSVFSCTAQFRCRRHTKRMVYPAEMLSVHIHRRFIKRNSACRRQYAPERLRR